MTPLLALLVLAGLPVQGVAPAPAAPAGAPTEMRGLWVVRTALVSPQAVDAVVDQAKQAGFNALFVQVRGRGDAFYSSRLVPRSLLLEGQPASFDPLARLLRRAHGQGLQVHAWVNVLLAAGFVGPWPRGHVAALHPDWLMVPQVAAADALAAPREAWTRLIRDAAPNDTEGFYLSPSAAGVPEHLEAVVRELVRAYPVDGLHLDFIRYPGVDYDYSRAALEGFRAPTAKGGVFRIAELLAGPAGEPERWAAYLRQRLTALAERLSRGARAERAGLVVSAAVVPDEVQAVTERFQDWPSWLPAGIVDALCPMAYTPDARLFRQQVEQARARAGRVKVWAGVGAYRLTPSAVVDRVRAAREAGAEGVVLFSHESLDASGWARLRAEAFVPAAAVETPSATGGREPLITRSPR
jgi:uncharacterized lipoprotein YddW (UPF0748 family)